ncbi:hypothetical protein NSPZN2_150045 [Nitrospira defluvii]|uniref:Uncharacterized protein n=1 Tax=Nitrospira defluvii TaxID=330214 RepID=A0ABM8RAV0_9BACT|nr:hypothetical protein NSPZN2_150045 [Nitrospira defluvii]
MLPAMNQHIGKKVYVTKHGISIIPRSQTEKKKSSSRPTRTPPHTRKIRNHDWIATYE